MADVNIPMGGGVRITGIDWVRPTRGSLYLQGTSIPYPSTGVLVETRTIPSGYSIKNGFILLMYPDLFGLTNAGMYDHETKPIWFSSNANVRTQILYSEQIALYGTWDGADTIEITCDRIGSSGFTIRASFGFAFFR